MEASNTDKKKIVSTTNSYLAAGLGAAVVGGVGTYKLHRHIKNYQKLQNKLHYIQDKLLLIDSQVRLMAATDDHQEIIERIQNHLNKLILKINTPFG